MSLDPILVLDAAAAAVALPTLVLDLVAIAGGRVEQEHSALGRLFHRLDTRCGHLLSVASYLAFLYLLVRIGAVVAAAPWPLAARVSIVAGLAFVAVALVQPITTVYNVLGWLTWRNPPLHLDKSRYFRASARLEDPQTFAAIRAEALRIVDSARPFSEVYGNVSIVDASRAVAPANALAAAGWRSFQLRIADGDVLANHARMPVLAQLLREMPEVSSAFLSILDGGCRLEPHRGYFKGILRYHLGLIVPAPHDVWLLCGGERYHWQEGEGVLFDDMYVHSVENRSSQPRLVLFLDVRRPVGVLGTAVRDAVQWLARVHPYHVAARKRAAAP
jgi:hypothetical protein